jgi:hypothetical protein
MAQNDVIDIDEIIDQNIDYSQPIPTMTQPIPPAVIDQVYPSGQETPGQLIPNDFKNYILEKTSIDPSFLDTLLGRPYSFRDRFLNLNPKDFERDVKRFLLPGRQPLDRETQQPFGLDIMELFNPTDPATKRAESLGIETDKGAPFRVQKDATYLPADNYERGVKALLREAYPGVPLEAFELAKEPNTNRIVYKDPESGEKQFVSPPGIDFADVTAVMEPLSLEIGAGLLGFGLGSSVGIPAGAVIGGMGGLLGTAQLTDNEFWQATGAAAGAAAGAARAPITFTIMGETMAHFLWRYNNLRNMKDRGILDETYDSAKILKTAIDDSKMVAAYSAGGNAAFAGIAKFLGRNPAGVLGIDQDEFLNAFDEIQKRIEAGGPETTVLANLSTPQVLAAADEGLPKRIEAGQREIQKSIEKRPEVERRFVGQEQDIDLGYEKVFDDLGIDTVVFRDQDMANVKRDFGRNVAGYFDPENIKPQTGKKVVPTDRRAVANKVQSLARGADPEGIFDEIWTAGKITRVDTFLDMMPESAQGQFRNLIYRDFLEKTKPIDGTFDPTAVSKYLVQHGDQLKSIYGEEFVNGLRTYNKLAKDVTKIANVLEVPDAELAKMVNVFARAYLGIFTRPGRLITAATRSTERFRRASFEEMLLYPDELAKRLKTKKFFESDEGRRFFVGARALARAYEKTDGDLADLEKGEETELETQKQITGEDILSLYNIEDLEMKKGGNPLMELKYGIGD